MTSVPTSTQTERKPGGLSLERVVFFSDAVFAVAISLLALEVRVPEGRGGGLPHALREMVPSIAIYALSFFVVALYWVGHHRMFHAIVRVDYPLVWLNLLKLLCVAFLPVANSVLVHYYHEPFAILFFCATLCGASATSLLLWRYASRRHRLIAPDLDSHTIKLGVLRNVTTIVVSCLIVGVAFVSTTTALVLLYLAAAYAAISNRGGPSS
jgi:uncharacterized membrane protein